MAYLVGTDIGTSGTKSVIFTEDGSIVSVGSKQYTYDIPHAGHAEQWPDVWWEAAASSIKDALDAARISADEIAGVGLSGQMHGMAPLDANGNAVRPAILHCDVRSSDVVEDINAAHGENFIYEITYNPAFAGFQLVSLEWMRRHEPSNYNKTATVICPKDYVRLKLTGETGAEATDASGTLAYDLAAQGWSKEILGKLSHPLSLFPAHIGGPQEIAGYITAETSEKTGLKKGIPVVYGGADQAVHSLGNGITQSGVMMSTIGTSGQILMLTDKLVNNPNKNTNTFRHINKDVWYGLGGILHAGVNLKWFLNNFPVAANFKEASMLAEKAEPCCGGLVFFPAMGGERAPYLDAQTRGVFLGMLLSHRPEHFIRAIMEGIVFEMRAAAEILKGLYGAPQKIICAGGGANSPVWRQIQADVYGSDVCVSDIPEQGCLGAAILAGVGAGVFKDITEGAAAMINSDEKIISPIIENQKKYDDFYNEIFCGIYPNNRGLFAKTWGY